MDIKQILAIMTEVAENPYENAKQWKAAGEGRKVAGILPMHVPAELYHAAGVRPVLLQEVNDTITLGHSYIHTFYCGFSRSVADQAAKGILDFIDLFVVGNGISSVQGLCLQDIITVIYPDKFVDTNEIIQFTNLAWTKERTIYTYGMMKGTVEEMTGEKITDEALWNSIKLYNRGRQLMRELYEERRKGNALLTPKDLQYIVKASMVMDKAEHNALLEELVPQVKANAVARPAGLIPVYVSGHMCHAPKPDYLRLIEECGGYIVDDDLYTGYRYICADVKEDGDTDPTAALAQYYMDKNKVLPCPTRVDPLTNWDKTILNAVNETGAKGLVILQVKYCEPQMFFFPEIKETFEAAGVPYLLLETEHEVTSLENIRTRIESFIEKLRDM